MVSQSTFLVEIPGRWIFINVYYRKNYDTIHGYRNSHRSLKEGHPFERLSDHDLRSIGAAAISDEDSKLHPTAAGMLMFGDEYNIVRHFPEYFLDYREEVDPTTRWSDRL